MYLNSASSGKTSAYKMKWQISELYQLSKSKKLSLSIQHKQRKLIKEQTESDPRGLSGSYPEVFLKAKSQKLDISWSGANNQQITINNPLQHSRTFSLRLRFLTTSMASLSSSVIANPLANTDYTFLYTTTPTPTLYCLKLLPYLGTLRYIGFLIIFIVMQCRSTT